MEKLRKITGRKLARVINDESTPLDYGKSPGVSFLASDIVVFLPPPLASAPYTFETQRETGRLTRIHGLAYSQVEQTGRPEDRGGKGLKRRTRRNGVAESEENGPPPVISLEPAAFPSRQITTSPPSLFWYQIKPHTGRPCLFVSSALR